MEKGGSAGALELIRSTTVTCDCGFAEDFCMKLYMPRSFVFNYLCIASQFISHMKKKTLVHMKKKDGMRILIKVVMLKGESGVAREHVSSCAGINSSQESKHYSSRSPSCEVYHYLGDKFTISHHLVWISQKNLTLSQAVVSNNWQEVE